MATNTTSPVISHWTREQASKISVSTATTFPTFNPARLGAMIPGYNVWDNWIVLDENSEIASVQGYRVLIALVAPTDKNVPTRLYYFYSKDGVNYTKGGYVTDRLLDKDGSEWSGSTILRADGTLQTFYTIAKASSTASTQKDQRLATLTQKVAVMGGKLVLQKPLYHALLATPDGHYYQTPQQAHQYEKSHPAAKGKVGNNKTNNFCFRDPHFFKDPATKKTYLLFEANTGSDYCAEASTSRDYVGSSRYEPRYVPTTDAYKANGCIGIAELTDNTYRTIKYLPPLLTANLVTDEIERANIIVHKGGYYLFCVTRARKMTLTNDAILDSAFMLGFRASSLFGQYVPLNDSGVVIRQHHGSGGEGSNPQNVYSFLVLPDMSVITYANYCSDGKGSVQRCRTAGPSVQLHIDGTTTRLGEIAYSLLPA